MGRGAPDADKIERGWPRRFIDFQRPTPNFPFEKLPVPWINWGQSVKHNDWLAFDERTLPEIDEANYKLCSVCGEELGLVKIFGLLGAYLKPNEQLRTSGTGMHPRCALMATKFCPHLKEEDGKVCFAVYRGDGHGLDLGSTSRSDDGTYDLTDPCLDSSAEPIKVEEIRALVD